MLYCCRQITRERKCWSCPNISPVTADLVQDLDLRREIKLWLESQDSQKKERLASQKKSFDTQEQSLDSQDKTLQLPDPVPIQTKESDSVTLVDIPECPVKTPEDSAAVDNNEDAFPDNTESEDEVTFQGITFSADVQKPVIESDHTEEADVANVDDSSDGTVGDISDAAEAAVTSLPEVDEEVVPCCAYFLLHTMYPLFDLQKPRVKSGPLLSRPLRV